jgi:hypothetical protein
MQDKDTIRRAIAKFLATPGDYSGYLSDDNGWSEEAIADHLISVRASVLRDALRTGEGVTEFSYQILDCVEVKLLDKNECPCAPASGCVWLRTKHPIPKPISIKSVSDNIGHETFDKKKWTELKRIKHSRIKSARNKRYFAFKESGTSEYYLYIHVPEAEDMMLQSITVQGIFAKPIEAEKVPRCGKQSKLPFCNPMDIPFFVEEELQEIIFNRTWATLIQLRNSAPMDNLNNDGRDRAIYEKQV